MYRVGRRAHAHGTYIRPDHTRVWRLAIAEARQNRVSISRFVSEALSVFMTGRAMDGRVVQFKRLPADLLRRRNRRAL